MTFRDETFWKVKAICGEDSEEDNEDDACG
jgi:hypothetical protein